MRHMEEENILTPPTPDYLRIGQGDDEVFKLCEMSVFKRLQF